MSSSPVSPATHLPQQYVPRTEASEMYDVPLHMIEYWLAMRRVRIAEFKKEGEGKRSIYVNKEDVGKLKDLYDLSVDILEAEQDDITYADCLEEFPQISKELLHYMISNCLVDCYIPDATSFDQSTLRKSDIVKACALLHKADVHYDFLLRRNLLFLERDVNDFQKKMLYIYAFFNQFKQYEFHPVESQNLRCITIVVNRSTRLEYREGFNIIDLIINNQFTAITANRELVKLRSGSETSL